MIGLAVVNLAGPRSAAPAPQFPPQLTKGRGGAGMAIVRSCVAPVAYSCGKARLSNRLTGRHQVSAPTSKLVRTRRKSPTTARPSLRGLRNRRPPARTLSPSSGFTVLSQRRCRQTPFSLPASLPELSGAERNLGSRLPRSRLAGAGWNDGNFKVAPAPATAWPALSTNKNVIRALGRPTICRPPSVSGSYPV